MAFIELHYHSDALKTAVSVNVLLPEKSKTLIGMDGKQEENMKTVFLLRCGNALALQKRPNNGLLAGMWQLPCFNGELDEQQALQKLVDLQLQPSALCLYSRKKHVLRSLLHFRE